jgi:hypothetical protein
VTPFPDPLGIPAPLHGSGVVSFDMKSELTDHIDSAEKQYAEIGSKVLAPIDATISEAERDYHILSGQILGQVENQLDKAETDLNKRYDKINRDLMESMSNAYMQQAQMGFQWPTQDQVIEEVMSGQYQMPSQYSPPPGEYQPQTMQQQLLNPVDNSSMIDANYQSGGIPPKPDDSLLQPGCQWQTHHQGGGVYTWKQVCLTPQQQQPVTTTITNQWAPTQPDMGSVPLNSCDAIDLGNWFVWYQYPGFSGHWVKMNLAQ